MGLLKPGDWKAKWITDATLADPANRPLRPIHCYRSELATSSDLSKWIVLDLESRQAVDSVDLLPARPSGLNPDIRTVMFPHRFKVEVSDDAGFTEPQVVIDRTGEDINSPRGNDCVFKFASVKARYIRVTVTKLARWDGADYGVALGGLTVSAGDKIVSEAAQVSCSDSMETADYSKSYLGWKKNAVAIAPDSKGISVDFPGVPARQMVSRVPLLRRKFSIDGPVKRATLYITARGFYECHLNGRQVGDHLLDPGYTDYSKRIEYQSFDVTNQLHSGANALGVLLG